MAFQVTSSAAFAADPNHAADGAAHSAVANAPRGGSSSIVRRVLGWYVGFGLKPLSYSIHAFTSSPQVPSDSSIDQRAFIDSIFAQVKHQISGKQAEYDAALRKMQEVLDAAAARQAAGAGPQCGPRPAPQHTSTPPTQEAPQEPPHEGPQGTSQGTSQGAPQGASQEAPHGTSQERPQGASQGAPHTGNAAQADAPAPGPQGHDQEQARRQREQHQALRLRRSHEQTGRDNALSLLGGHAAPGSHDPFGHHGPQGGGVDSALLEEMRGMREAFEAFASRRSPRTDTDNG